MTHEPFSRPGALSQVADVLRADVQYPWRKILQQAAQELDRQALLLAEAEDVLFTIATPKRPDGTYNMGREACEQLARRVLEKLCTPVAHPTPAEGTQPSECTSPTLTDEERAAIGRIAGYHDVHVSMDDRDTLRGLLERLK